MEESRIVRLIEAIANAWTKSLPPPYGTGEYSSAVDGATDCNRYTQDVLRGAANHHKMDGLTANAMVDYMETTTDEFMDVPGDVAQAHANTGGIVIAGWKNPAGHGHVSVVRPGLAEASGSWGVMDNRVPKLANVGEPAFCRWDRKASFAFGKERIPKYYLLKGTEA